MKTQIVSLGSPNGIQSTHKHSVYVETSAMDTYRADIGSKEERAEREARKKEKDAEQGRAAWSALHNKTLGDPVWFSEWKKMIPQKCGCKKSSDQILDRCPPRYESADEWFSWTVEYHNLVNQKLIDAGDTTKKIITLEEARQIWNRTDIKTQECCHVDGPQARKECCRNSG